MKKYQLKYDDGTELKILKESDDIDRIIWSIIYNTTITRPYKCHRKLSIWVNGKKLK